MSIKNKATKLFRKLKRGTDFLSVKQYYEKKGWKIVSFNNDSQIITELHLQNNINSNGFIYCDETVKYIFIRSSLTPKEKRNVMFHEAGHIELNHMYSDLNSAAKEREATAFADVMIRKCADKDKCKLVICNAVIIVILASVCTVLFSHINTPTAEQINTERAETSIFDVQNPPDELSYVYVTPAGKKYHLENCAHIRNNAAKRMIDIKTAAQLYKPCLNCIN